MINFENMGNRYIGKGLGIFSSLNLSYSGKYVEPISTNYRGYDIYECPPNGQGIVALEGLNILSGFNMASYDPVSANRLHLEIEAMRLAYRDRSAMLGDPDFENIPVVEWLSEDHASAERARIDINKRMPNIPPTNLPRHNDTVYLTVVDKDRNAVSFINTLFSSFGSEVGGAGIQSLPFHMNLPSGLNVGSVMDGAQCIKLSKL